MTQIASGSLTKNTAEVKPLVPAVVSAVRIIDYLMTVDDGAGVSEIARELSLNKSTCFNILNALASFQVLSKHPRHAVYRLGPRLIEWGAGSRRKFSGRTLLHDKINSLVADINLTCIVGQVLADDEGIVVVDRVVPRREGVSTQAIGSVVPLTGPAMGRIVLAHREEHEALDTARRLGMVEPGGEEEFLDSIAQIRMAGYATSIGEYSPEVNAVAAPVIQNHSEIACILCVIGFTRHLPAAELPNIGTRLVQLVQKLGTRESIFAY
jgi:DNA-binding IclR family transcriptional regulator